MTDPYKTLGVDYRADEQQLKNAYKKMVKKYHPDRYHDPKEIEKANEKMTEINAAYDQIMEDRRLGVSPMKYATYTASEERKKKEREKRASSFRRYSAADYERYEYHAAQDMDFGIDYSDVRSAIERGDLTSADEKLGGIAEASRSAEWHYLKGLVYIKRGWLNEAYHSVRTATQMNPGNPEYAETFQQMNRARSGYMTSSASKAKKEKKNSGEGGGICPFGMKL